MWSWEIEFKVDCVWTHLPAEAGANAEDDEEQSQRYQISRPKVAIVFESIDQEHQDRAGDEFGEKLPGFGHELGRVCAEDTG